MIVPVPIPLEYPEQYEPIPDAFDGIEASSHPAANLVIDPQLSNNREPIYDLKRVRASANKKRRSTPQLT